MNNGLKIEQLNIAEQAARTVAIKTDENKNFIIDGKIEIWIAQAPLLKKYGQEVKYFTEVFAKILDYAVRNRTGVLLCGLLPFDIDITYEDLKSIYADIDTICIMMGYVEKKITLKEFLTEFAHRPVYFLGEFPKSLQKGETFGYAHIDHEKGSSIPVFIKKEFAENYNTQNYPITQTTLKNLLWFDTAYSLLIEPKHQYWCEVVIKETERIFHDN